MATTIETTSEPTAGPPLRGLGAMFWTELRLFVREPAAAFFTLAFPLILLFVFGSIFGNDPETDYSGWGAVDVLVQGYVGLIIGTIVFIGMPVTLAAYRQYGILKRLRATPVSAVTVILAHVLVNAVMFGFGVVLLFVAGKVVYDLRMPESPLGFIAACVLSYFSFAAIAFVIAGIFPTARTAQAVGSAVFFPQMFLSGAAFPREMFPDTLKSVTQFLPMTQINVLVADIWREGSWNGTAVIALVLIGVAGAVVSFWVFRWE